MTNHVPSNHHVGPTLQCHLPSHLQLLKVHQVQGVRAPPAEVPAVGWRPPCPAAHRATVGPWAPNCPTDRRTSAARTAGPEAPSGSGADRSGVELTNGRVDGSTERKGSREALQRTREVQ